MKIYIIRHGETIGNKNGILQGSIDTPLTDEGIRLARLTGEGLKDINFDIAYASPLSRAKDTASIIISKNNNKNIKLILDNRLKEINMGDWEGKHIKGEELDLDPDKLKQFFTNPFTLDKFPHGEDAYEVCKRTQDFLLELVNKDYQNVLIATHGFAVRAMLNFLYDDKSNFWQGHVPYNCAVNIIEYKDNKFNFIAKDKIYYDQNDCIDRYKI